MISGLDFSNSNLGVSCQTPKYQISLIYNIYNLNISRILPVDILVFIAVTCISALRPGIDDIKGFLDLSTFSIDRVFIGKHPLFFSYYSIQVAISYKPASKLVLS